MLGEVQKGKRGGNMGRKEGGKILYGQHWEIDADMVVG